ncbi:hypothetical protein [Paratractidigestivibacter sp.]|uniref:hypothetical protein n=1 Tax=Paratractidigestivibacter sp. TaxID=2847316 RepID=UPI002AC8A918|nr:hypothetical protein [Paratractidigestivibacter sp.]
MEKEYLDKANAYLKKMEEDSEFCGDGNRNSSAVDFVICFNIIKDADGEDPTAQDDDDLVYGYTNYLRTMAKNYDYQMLEHLERVTSYGKEWFSLPDHGLCKMVKYYM